jgi:hypothetical protein
MHYILLSVAARSDFVENIPLDKYKSMLDFQASTAVYLRPSLFGGLIRRMVVVGYGGFGKRREPIGFPETLVTNYEPTPCNVPEERVP